MPIFGGSKQKTSVTNNQTSVDGSATGTGAQSVTASQHSAVSLDQRSDYSEFGGGSLSGKGNTLQNQMTFGGSGLTVGAGAELSIATDHGAIDVAREVSLAALEGAQAYNRDMRHFVEVNQGMARSIAEGAFAVASDAPPPDTTRRALWIGGGLVALALILSAVSGLFKKGKKK